MKLNNKGKVHHSLDSSSSQPPTFSNHEKDILSVLQILPATILALVSVLSLDDKEVLAYMITRSLKTTLVDGSKKKPSSSKKVTPSTHASSPCFDLDSFDCYTSYWQKWSDSPNCQVIEQIIEAFEDHLSINEKSTKSNSRSRRSKNSRKLPPKSVLDNMGNLQTSIPTSNNQQSSSLKDVNPLPSNDGVAQLKEPSGDVEVVKEEALLTRRTQAAVNNRKGIARKVLPDVMGLLNSRLWNLWRPNV